MVRLIGTFTAFVAVIFVVGVFFATLPLSLFVLLGLGLWGWRMLTIRVQRAADAKPDPPSPSAPDPLAIWCGKGLEALEPLVGSATTAEQWETWRTGTTTPAGPAVRAPISRALRERIFRRDKYTCQECGAQKGERGVQLVIDHKKPVKRGGTNDPSNLQTLCSLCNSKKGAKNTGHGDRARDTPDE